MRIVWTRACVGDLDLAGTSSAPSVMPGTVIPKAVGYVRMWALVYEPNGWIQADTCTDIHMDIQMYVYAFMHA